MDASMHFNQNYSRYGLKLSMEASCGPIQLFFALRILLSRFHLEQPAAYQSARSFIPVPIFGM